MIKRRRKKRICLLYVKEIGTFCLPNSVKYLTSLGEGKMRLKSQKSDLLYTVMQFSFIFVIFFFVKFAEKSGSKIVHASLVLSQTIIKAKYFCYMFLRQPFLFSVFGFSLMLSM